jgi:hypothetical protein
MTCTIAPCRRWGCSLRPSSLWRRRTRADPSVTFRLEVAAVGGRKQARHGAEHRVADAPTLLPPCRCWQRGGHHPPTGPSCLDPVPLVGPPATASLTPAPARSTPDDPPGKDGEAMPRRARPVGRHDPTPRTRPGPVETTPPAHPGFQWPQGSGRSAPANADLLAPLIDEVGSAVGGDLVGPVPQAQIQLHRGTGEDDLGPLGGAWGGDDRPVADP